MMVWLSMSCMYVSVRMASAGTSYLGTSAQEMASKSRAPERATQASRSNGAIVVGQKYYSRRVQTSKKSVRCVETSQKHVPRGPSSLVATMGAAPADGPGRQA